MKTKTTDTIIHIIGIVIYVVSALCMLGIIFAVYKMHMLM